MKTFIGKNPDFVVVWNCNAQRYTVYKNHRFIINAYKWSDIQSYLN
jgi:hypothetical protein